MKKYFSSDFKLGVLGGGQLGRMLLTETQKFDVFTTILENNLSAPCAQIANEFVVGDIKNYDDVYRFGKKTDVLTIEIEHVNIEALKQLEKEGVKVYPQPKVLETIKHKGLQKDFYTAHAISTAKYKRFETLEALKENPFACPFIWKSAEFGYDGTGVKKINSLSDLDQLPNVACIIEELVPFKMELAVIVARSASGEIKTYPVVEMEFHPEANQVEYVLCPARVSEEIRNKSQAVALQVAHAFEHVGLLAVELFLTTDNEIIVNEVAPRPHNSGHFSIEGSFTNQFEQHLRAILDLPLGNTDTILPAVMVNLVGAENHVGDVQYKNMEDILKLKGVTPHIYGKKQTKPFRKMGHVTIIDDTIENARKTAEIVKKTIVVAS